MNKTLELLLTKVKSLPYGRNSNRADYTLVPLEEKGTCSTKHAFIKHMALQNNWPEVSLFIGIYLMSESNTPGVGEVLKKYSLKEIPEAHTYLKINGDLTDITGLGASVESFTETLQREEEILPDQIGDYKVKFHQDYISNWVKSSFYTAQKIWNIREECISQLSDLHKLD